MNPHSASTNPKKKKGKSLTSQCTSQPGLSHHEHATQRLDSPLISRDDFLLIEGIDATTEMALNSIGTRRFSDFRGHTPQRLSKMLHERTGISISPATIELQDWLGKATILADEESAPTVQGGEDGSDWQETYKDDFLQERHQVKKTTGAIVKEDSDPARKKSAKKAQGSITEAIETKTAKEVGREKAFLFTRDVRFSQFEKETTEAAVEKMLRSEINCELRGIDSLTVSVEPVFLCVQIYGVNTETIDCELLASKAEPLQPGRTDYIIQLEFKVSKVGRYQLQIALFLLKSDSSIAFHQGPLLRVIP